MHDKLIGRRCWNTPDLRQQVDQGATGIATVENRLSSVNWNMVTLPADQ